MDFIKMNLGQGRVNGYLVFDETSRETAIIDPGYDFLYIDQLLKKHKLLPKYILLTHGHGDHIGACRDLKEEYGDLSLGINVNDLEVLFDPALNLSEVLQGQAVSLEADFTFIDGEIIKLGEGSIRVLHTPGHSPGGSCFEIDGNLFVGDTIFREGIGRYDLYKGDLDLLLNSIKRKILTLDKETVLHPGHGPETTVSYELERNPYLR